MCVRVYACKRTIKFILVNWCAVHEMFIELDIEFSIICWLSLLFENISYFIGIFDIYAFK